jgi:hypothetical protein
VGGRTVHYTTVARWKSQGWRTVKSDHPLEIARRRIEAVAPLVSGDPETTVQDLIDDARNDFDALPDSQVLRRAAREAAIATALVAKAIQNRVTTSDFDLLELAPAVIAVGRAINVLPSAFDQAINLEVADQRGNGFRTKG